jgi:hypothetical protein
MRDETSRAPERFSSEINAFIAYLQLERGLSVNTWQAYQRDIDQCADFLARRAPTSDWTSVQAADLTALAASPVGRGLEVVESGAKTDGGPGLFPVPGARAATRGRSDLTLDGRKTSAPIAGHLVRTGGGATASGAHGRRRIRAARSRDPGSLLRQRTSGVGVGPPRVEPDRFGARLRASVWQRIERTDRAPGPTGGGGGPGIPQRRTTSLCPEQEDRRTTLSQRARRCALPGHAVGLGQTLRTKGGNHPNRETSPAAAFVRHSFARRRCRPSFHPGNAGPLKHFNYRNLHIRISRPAPRSPCAVSPEKQSEGGAVTSGARETP